MTEENEIKQGISIPTQANATGWNKLSNELQHKIIAHAVDDSDAWKANETYGAVSRTSRHLHNLAASSKALRQYKDNLDGGRLVSDAVIETAFPDKNFSDRPIRWDRRQRHIGKEAAASTPALEFQSPEMRSEIFNNIAAKAVDKRMLGYSYIAERADLFQEHETSHMDRDALNTFREDNPPGALTRFSAAVVLVKRYNDIAPEVRTELQEAVSKKENQRVDFSDAIVNCNPSLLKDDSLRLLVSESLHHLQDPHEALAQLASYIDKNSQADTDFIVEQSLRHFGGNTVHGEEHGLKAPALAIAKVFDGNIRQEHRDRIAELRQSDTEEGRALASAFKEPERDRPAEASIESGMNGSAKLLRKVVRSQNMSDKVAAIDGVGDVAKSNAKQMNAAREALMNSVCDRNDRVR
jgi:hypothetical protein